MRLPLTTAIAALTMSTAPAATVLYNAFSNTPIPDNNTVGVASSISATNNIFSITDITVTLRIDGGYNGDYYAFLTNGSKLAVLLNRVGRTAASLAGAPDSGLNITLNDAAPAGDIHNYQTSTNPMGAALTGLWAPDGRNVNPAVALDTTPRTAGLSTFMGESGSGQWTLYVVDSSLVGIGSLVSWSIEITGVPEPTSLGLLALGGGLIARRRRR